MKSAVCTSQHNTRPAYQSKAWRVATSLELIRPLTGYRCKSRPTRSSVNLHILYSHASLCGYERILMIHLAVLTQYRSVTDRQTECHSIVTLCAASFQTREKSTVDDQIVSKVSILKA